MSDTNLHKDVGAAYQTTDGYYLPDLSKPQAVLGLLLSIELFVGALALIKYPVGSIEFLSFFGGLSFLMLWIGIVFAMLIQSLKPFLARHNVILSTILQLSVLLALTVLFTYITRVLVLRYLGFSQLANLLQSEPKQFYFNNVFLCLLVGSLLMRYFYIAHQNQEKIKAVSVAQIQALQSRIRPHFLFNSLNSIASLIRIDPELAEQSVEDLADLFRASLSDGMRRVSLKEELEIARLYQRIEQLRLGERLQVNWLLSELPLRQMVPVLILQPLLENAIYHGIEPRTTGGTVTVKASVIESGNNKTVEISVTNPLPKLHNGQNSVYRRKNGNQIALKNIEQRLRLVYGGKAQVKVNSDHITYQVNLSFPFEAEVE